MGSVSGKVKTLSSEKESSESDEESRKYDKESCEADEDVDSTPVDNSESKKDKFWNMPPLLKTPVLDINSKKVNGKLLSDVQSCFARNIQEVYELFGVEGSAISKYTENNWKTDTNLLQMLNHLKNEYASTFLAITLKISNPSNLEKTHFSE